MPHFCPICRAALPRDSHFCLHCSSFHPPLPVTERAASPFLPNPGPAPIPVSVVPARASRWPRAALGLLVGALLVSAYLAGQSSRKTPSILVDAYQAQLSPYPHALPPQAARPLTVDLRYSHADRRVTLGSLIVLTASAPARAQAVALFCRRDGRRLTRFSLAEGHLCSAAWMPPAPGRYQFTATASDGGVHSARSRSVWITVIPSAPALAHARLETARGLPPHRRHFFLASRPALTRLVSLPLAAPPIHSMPDSLPTAPASPLRYHVVAAAFFRPRNAVVLAKSFWNRDIKADVRRMPDRDGKEVDAVETGGYHHPEDAQEAALALQRSGYPAYSVDSR